MKNTLLKAAVILMILALPFIMWLFQDHKPLKIAIIDKTVPAENYREHKGLTWILNHNRYSKKDGTNYQAESDYYGFKPDEANENYDIKEITELDTDYDLIYLADTYGVYKEDLSWNNKENEEPELIYGGLLKDEWQGIKQRVMDDGSDLIVEFNTFASPTEKSVSADMEQFLGVKWSGWTGRYFLDLTEGVEVPEWAIDNYERDNEKWDYENGGFVLVDDTSGQIIVLSEQDQDITDDGLRVSFTDAGKSSFDLSESPSFGYWFDINEAQGADVLAEYKWELTDKGESILSDYGIPTSFPAIFHKRVNDADVYYFAGDFVDVEIVPTIYQYSGFAEMRSLLALEAFGRSDNFYWKTYVPIMKSILADTYDKEKSD